MADFTIKQDAQNPVTKWQPSDRLTTAELAEYLEVRPQTIRKWRSVGEGPPWEEPRPRVIRYCFADVLAWLSDSKVESV